MTDLGAEDRSSRSDSEAMSTLARGAGVSLAGRILGRLAHVAVQILMARVLGPPAFGLFALAFTVLRMTGLVAPLGLHRGTLYFAARYWPQDPPAFSSVARYALSGSFLGGVAVAGVVWTAAPWVAESVFGKPELSSVLRGLILALPAASALRVAVALTQVGQRMGDAVISEDLAQPLFALIAFPILFALGYGMGAAVSATVSSHVVALVVALALVHRQFPRLATTPAPAQAGELVRDLMRFSLPAAFAGVFMLFLVWIDRLLVGVFLDSSRVGYYQAASQVSILYGIILAGFGRILAPMVSNLHARNRTADLEETYRAATKWGLYVSLPPFLVTCAMPETVMTVLYGQAYAEGAVALLVLSIGQLVNVGSGNVGIALVMTGNERRWLRLTGLTFTANVGLCCLLIPRYGLAGAAVATSVSIAALFAVGVFALRSWTGLWPYDRRYFKGLGAAALAALPAMALSTSSSAVALEPATRLTLAAVTVTLVFFAALGAAGLDDEDRMLLSRFTRKGRR